MRRWLWSMLAAMVFLWLTILPAAACTNLILKTANGDVIRARTMELGGDMDSEFLIFPKGTALVGYAPDGTQNGLHWTSSYTAAGLNGFHLDLIVDGMNDQGLSGGMLMFPTFAQSQAPDPAALDRTIASEQIVTWALTQFGTVEEIAAALPNVHVIDVSLPPLPPSSPLSGPFHLYGSHG